MKLSDQPKNSLAIAFLVYNKCLFVISAMSHRNRLHVAVQLFKKVHLNKYAKADRNIDMSIYVGSFCSHGPSINLSSLSSNSPTSRVSQPGDIVKHVLISLSSLYFSPQFCHMCTQEPVLVA